MTEISTLERLAPRGSLQRFTLAGAFNSVVFFLLWEFIRFFLDEDKAGLQTAWAISWGATALMAHFIHRWFTFDNRKSMQWTLGASVGAYTFSLTGSTYTIGLFANQTGDSLRLIGIGNMVLWGLIIWAIMRLFVFQFSTEQD